MKQIIKQKSSLPDQEDKGYFLRMLIYVAIAILCVVVIIYATIDLVHTIEENATISVSP